MPQPKSLTVKKPDDYTLSHYTSGMNNAENRKLCVTALKNFNFTVNLVAIDGDAVNQNADQIENSAASHGTAWVLCNVDAGDSSAPDANNWPINVGEKVCLDLITCKAVTGFNPHWQAGEYIVIGTALDFFDGPGFGRIPVKLEPIPKISSVNFLGMYSGVGDWLVDTGKMVDVFGGPQGSEGPTGATQWVWNKFGTIVSGAFVWCGQNDSGFWYAISTSC